MDTTNMRLGEILVAKKLITTGQLGDILELQSSLPEHKRLGQLLVQEGFITGQQLLRNVPYEHMYTELPNSRILVVEDTGAMRRVIHKILSSLGCRVLEAANGTDALNMLDAESPSSLKIDLVLSDLMMPGMTGIELMLQIRSKPKLSHIPVAVITAVQDRNMVVECLHYGISAYIVKPFSSFTLLENAEQALAASRKVLKKRKSGILTCPHADPSLEEKFQQNRCETCPIPEFVAKAFSLAPNLVKNREMSVLVSRMQSKCEPIRTVIEAFLQERMKTK